MPAKFREVLADVELGYLAIWGTFTFTIFAEFAPLFKADYIWTFLNVGYILSMLGNILNLGVAAFRINRALDNKSKALQNVVMVGGTFWFHYKFTSNNREWKQQICSDASERLWRRQVRGEAKHCLLDPDNKTFEVVDGRKLKSVNYIPFEFERWQTFFLPDL